MNTNETRYEWLVEGTLARLQAPPLPAPRRQALSQQNPPQLYPPLLRATVDLLNPHLGLGQLVYRDVPTSGFVQGIALGTTDPFSNQELSEIYVRGGDLVVSYAETQRRPFSLQIYWRATADKRGALLLDTILSLETDLLESFPDLTAKTQLPATAAWSLSSDESNDESSGASSGASNVEKIALAEGRAVNLNANRVLLQPTGFDWSYAEAMHPADRSKSQLICTKGESLTMERQLGGQFLEKGVIRRLRGVFLPKAEDFEGAAQSLDPLESEAPPLTA